ncbi:MAG: anthranilate phosphoribosyltransferase [bacterium]|jgi:anthranilate phosphoribosyltransferase
MDFVSILEQLIAGKSLSQEVAGEAISAVMTGELTEVQASSLLTALRCKGETVDEIIGAARAMRAHATKIPSRTQGVIDTCGTGGDRHGSFNISTTASFVIAAAGIPVAKHGNRSATSKCGSIDLFEYLGINVMMTPEQMAHCLHTTGLSVLFARVVHPAMKYAAPVRTALKFRTIFNFLGPLTNPTVPDFQLIGISDQQYLEIYASCLQQLGVKKAWIVHGTDGMDEITLSGPTQVIEVTPDNLSTLEIHPQDVGLNIYPLDALKGGDVAVNAGITMRILEGSEQSAPREAVLMNAGAAIYIAGKVDTIRDGVALAEEVLSSGKARQVLENLRTASQEEVSIGA